MAKPKGWRTIESAPDGELVHTCIDAGRVSERNVQTMKRHGAMWFIGNMYTYYEPTHWAPMEVR